MVSLQRSDLLEDLRGLFRAELEEESSGRWRLTPRMSNARAHSFDIADIDVLLEDLEACTETTEAKIGLIAPGEIEMLVREESRFGGIMPRRDEPLSLHDPDGQWTYRIGAPSHRFVTWLLHRLLAADTRSGFLRSTSFMLRRALERQDDGEEGLAALLDSVARRYITVRVLGLRNRDPVELFTAANACLFQLAFNANLALAPVRSFSDIVDTARLVSHRRARMEEVEAPKRIYDEDLVQHYLAALASEDPASQFLNYYHISEHFLDAVFEDRMLKLVRDRLTAPNFSLRRDADLRALVKLVQKEARETREEHVSFDERLALQLTFERYIDFVALQAEVRAFDTSLVTYYASNKVQFADAPPVDLTMAGEGSGPAVALSRRIYKIRNAIVHAKGGERHRYKRNSHEDTLRKELPLMRFVAEQVMLGTSRIMP